MPPRMSEVRLSPTIRAVRRVKVRDGGKAGVEEAPGWAYRPPSVSEMKMSLENTGRCPRSRAGCAWTAAVPLVARYRSYRGARASSSSWRAGHEEVALGQIALIDSPQTSSLEQHGTPAPANSRSNRRVSTWSRVSFPSSSSSHCRRLMVVIPVQQLRPWGLRESCRSVRRERLPLRLVKVQNGVVQVQKNRLYRSLHLSLRIF